MLITRISPITRTPSSLDLNVTPDQVRAYESGCVKVQDAFPHLGVAEREFIKSGYTLAEQDELFRPPSFADEDDERFVDVGLRAGCEECARSFGPHYSGPCEHGRAS